MEEKEGMRESKAQMKPDRARNGSDWDGSLFNCSTFGRPINSHLGAHGSSNSTNVNTKINKIMASLAFRLSLSLLLNHWRATTDQIPSINPVEAGGWLSQNVRADSDDNHMLFSSSLSEPLSSLKADQLWLFSWLLFKQTFLPDGYIVRALYNAWFNIIKSSWFATSKRMSSKSQVKLLIWENLCILLLVVALAFMRNINAKLNAFHQLLLSITA